MPANMALLSQQAGIRFQTLKSVSLNVVNFPRVLTPARASHILKRNLIISAGMQQPLSSGERKTLRSESQRLGKAIVTTQLGLKGMTPAFIESAASALIANGFIKVRVGGDEEIQQVAEALEEACDCVVVHKIGFVLTLYRDKSLPPPACLGGPKDALEAAEIEAEAKNKKKAKRKQPPPPTGPPPPPEFTIL